MTLINQYRYGDENLDELQVPDINVAQPEVPQVAQALGSVNPDGTIASFGQMQGSDINTAPTIQEPSADFTATTNALNKQVAEQTAGQVEAINTQNQVAADMVKQDTSADLFTPTFDNNYDYHAINARYDGLLEQIRTQPPEVTLTPRIGTGIAKEQEATEPSWLDRIGQAVSFGGNVLQGATYDFANRSNKLNAELDDTFKLNPAANAVNQWTKGVMNGISDAIPDITRNDVRKIPFVGNFIADIVPTTKFDPKANYFKDAIEGNDMSVFGTTIEQVGQKGKSPIAVKKEGDAWNSTRGIAALVTDFGLGFLSGATLQRGAAGLIGAGAKAVSGSAKAGNIARKTTDILIDPAGEALGAVVGAGVKRVKSLVRPAGSKAVADAIPTASVSLTKVAPKAAASISPGATVSTLTGSGRVATVDFEKGVLTYKNSVGASVTANINELTDGAEDVLVGAPAKGGASLPLVTPSRRVSIPLVDGSSRPTTSVRMASENVFKLTNDFASTQPSITPYRLSTVPPSVVETELPGVVTSAEGRLNFLQQQQALGSSIDTDELNELISKAGLAPDIPEVDARVFTGAMSYGDLGEVIGQQVPGTQVDPAALFQAPRSTEDIVTLAKRLGLEVPDVPATNAELLEYLYKQAPDNLDIRNVLNEYGVPVPTQTLKEAADIRVKVQEGVPFKAPEADVIVRQTPIINAPNELDELLSTRKQVADLGTLTQNMRRNLEQLNNTLDMSTSRTLETPDIGRKYDPDFRAGEPQPVTPSFKKASKTYSNLMHGTRVSNITNFDAVASGSRAELGTGFYVSTNPDVAKSYALAEIAPNLPSAGRQYGSPQVISYALDDSAKVLDVADEATDDIKAAFSEVLDKRQLTNAKTVEDLYNAVDKNIVKYGYDEQLSTQAYASINTKLRDAGIKAVKKLDTLNVLDMGALKQNYAQPIKASDDVLEAVAHRYNVDSRRAALNPKNIQAQVDFEESSVRLQAEMKGKLETDLEAVELNQRNAITKHLDEQTRIDAEVERTRTIEEESRAKARTAKATRELDKLFDPETNLDVCKP